MGRKKPIVMKGDTSSFRVTDVGPSVDFEFENSTGIKGLRLHHDHVIVVTEWLMQWCQLQLDVNET